MSEDIYLLVVPADGLCQGCGDPLGEEVFEDDMGIILCRGCWDLCEEEG
jgi:hypothetical protein